MAFASVQQRAEGLAGRAAGGGESLAHMLGDVLVRQPPEPNRNR
jgi:hypothetical protein